MNILRLSTTPEASICDAFSEFESQFKYPLTESTWFRICHQKDYTLFFRGIGDSVVFAAQKESRIVGSIAACIRELKYANGKVVRVAYLCDLKISNQGANQALFHLLKDVAAWCIDRADCAMSVVMDGTRVTPDKYSGRLGLPAMNKVGNLAIFQLSEVKPDAVKTDSIHIISSEQAKSLAFETSETCFLDTSRARRSFMEPIWLASESGSTIACLEDTRLAKRLYREDGTEIKNCHLTNLRFQNRGDGLALIGKSIEISKASGFDGVFLALDEKRKDLLRDADGQFDFESSQAIIYGINLEKGSNLNINTTEV